MADPTRKSSHRDETEAELAATVTDPVKFSRVLLGSDLWEKQEAILRALAKPNAQVAVRACHASTKTFTAGDAVVWFMTLYGDAIVPTTAPTWSQVKLLLWKEIARAREKLDRHIAGLPEVFQTDWKFNKQHYAVGISTLEAERFQGFHAPHVLVVLDEAPGVRDPIYIAIDGIRAGGDVRVLALGNPTISHGPFYNAFGPDRASWTTISISAFDTPNLAGLTLDDLLAMERDNPAELYNNPRPYMITRAWVVQMYHKWGVNSPLWLSRVMGQFPGKGEDNLIALDWIEAARAVPPRHGAHCLGVDVARYGSNYTAYTELRGNEVVRMWKVQSRDNLAIFGTIKSMWRSDPALSVVVDDSGVGGGVVDLCRAEDIPVVAYNAGNTPIYNDDVQNRGSESYWSLSKALEDGDVAIGEGVDQETFDELAEQLVGIEYTFTVKGKIHVHKQGIQGTLPSPDYGDSLNMAWEAHRVEIYNPALTSVQIEPTAGDGLLSRDTHEAEGFWGGRGGSSSARPDRGRMFTQSAYTYETDSTGNRPVELDTVEQTSIICQECGDLAVVVPIGRTGTTRHLQLTCHHCGFKRVIHSETKAAVR